MLEHVRYREICFGNVSLYSRYEPVTRVTVRCQMQMLHHIRQCEQIMT
jgi:hypothetical protein